MWPHPAPRSVLEQSPQRGPLSLQDPAVLGKQPPACPGHLWDEVSPAGRRSGKCAWPGAGGILLPAALGPLPSLWVQVPLAATYLPLRGTSGWDQQLPALGSEWVWAWWGRGWQFLLRFGDGMCQNSASVCLLSSFFPLGKKKEV